LPADLRLVIGAVPVGFAAAAVNGLGPNIAPEPRRANLAFRAGCSGRLEWPNL